MKQLTFTQCKEVKSFCEDLCGSVDWRELIGKMVAYESDFELDNYRFISKDQIDQIQRDELANDAYILGCFNDWFIADNTDLSFDIVKALQSAEKFEAIGQHIIDNDFVGDIQEAYSSADGYGHHFAGYDGDTMEDLLEFGYYCFRTN